MTPTPQKFVEAKNLAFDIAGFLHQHIQFYSKSGEKNSKLFLHKIERVLQMKSSPLALALSTSHDEGVREEREACAKVAETAYNALHSQAAHLIADHIATKIRQRSSTNDEP